MHSLTYYIPAEPSSAAFRPSDVLSQKNLYYPLVHSALAKRNICFIFAYLKNSQIVSGVQ